jgi:hypothetical protein
MSERAYKLGLVALFLAAAIGFTFLGEKWGAGISFGIAIAALVLA